MPDINVDAASQHGNAGGHGLREIATAVLARPAGWTLCLTLLLALAVLRIASTYTVFNATIDEGTHVASGIEWLEKGVYRIETRNPPLARISVALAPYLSGVRGVGNPTSWEETYPILSATGHYWQTLTLARVGVLPYFVLCTLVVFFWTKRLFGARTALLAALVFTWLPTILAHTGVATTDIPLTAMFCLSLYALTLWLREPTWRTAAQFGAAAGLALSTKFSTLLFLPTCAAAILALYAAAGRPDWRGLFRTLGVAVLCAFLVTWTIYRFSHAPMNQISHYPDRVAVELFGPTAPTAQTVHRLIAGLQLPAPELFDGIRVLREQNREGNRSYLFGQAKNGGWWYFYLVSLAVKTPLAVLLLACIGAAAVLARYLPDRSRWEIAAPPAAAAMLLIVTAPARINIGVRHVMPMFVFISMLAALGLAVLWQSRVQRPICRGAALVLVGWLLVSSGKAHPDYLAYFNELGGRDPARILVISDLDWGQDLARLATWLHDRQIQHISVGLDTFFDPKTLGFPETNQMRCDAARPVGWIAMEVRRVRRSPECFTWLGGQPPIATVGKTMLMYYVPEP
ncbi:MAG: hypothetical protein JWO52_269 [Gammaproteobacteria bacterium]|jgi:hypothetical protein|nr:hypothetical protein [Gammaproteobacteria bacterium]